MKPALVLEYGWNVLSDWLREYGYGNLDHALKERAKRIFREVRAHRDRMLNDHRRYLVS